MGYGLWESGWRRAERGDDVMSLFLLESHDKLDNSQALLRVLTGQCETSAAEITEVGRNHSYRKELSSRHDEIVRGS